MSYALAMSGSIGADPTPATDSAALMQSIDLSFQATYDAAFSIAIPIAASSGSPFVPALGGVVAVRAIALRSVDGESLVLKLTSAQGALQAIPVSDIFLVQAQNEGDQFTAIEIIGTGRIELLVGGNETT